MSNTTTSEHQSLVDITIQECGDLEQVFELALINGYSASDAPNVGAKIAIPAAKNNTEVAMFFKKKNIRIATANIDATFARQQLFEDGLFQPGLFE